jgi:MFS-type transporter involved in bile tolerance (Atg22 family)
MTDLLESKYKVSDSLAPNIYGIPYFMSAGLSPILGIIIDKIGMRVHLSKHLIIFFKIGK